MLVALGTPLKGRPRPWEHFKVPALMTNAYEIVKNQGLRQEIQAKGGLHKFLNYDGTIFLDSGGFQAMAYRIDIELKTLIDVYRKIEADYYFSLDYPSLSARNYRKKTMRTISNYIELKKAVDHVIPVVHPNKGRALMEFEAYEKHDAEYVAIGGLVPMMRTSKGIANGRKEAIDLISEIRHRHRAFLHIMGLGAPTVVPILKVLGCTSTDSAAWRVKAAHGKIMIPSKGERYVSNKKARFGVVSLSEEERLAVERTNCPILREYGWEGLEKSFGTRALMNAWMSVHCAKTQNELDGPFSLLLTYAKGLGN